MDGLTRQPTYSDSFVVVLMLALLALMLSIFVLGPHLLPYLIPHPKNDTWALTTPKNRDKYRRLAIIELNRSPVVDEPAPVEVTPRFQAQSANPQVATKQKEDVGYGQKEWELERELEQLNLLVVEPAKRGASLNSKRLIPFS